MVLAAIQGLLVGSYAPSLFGCDYESRCHLHDPVVSGTLDSSTLPSDLGIISPLFLDSETCFYNFVLFKNITNCLTNINNSIEMAF